MDTYARRLTDASVRNAKPQAKPYKITDGGGLFLLVQPTGAKLWRFKFRLNGESLFAIGAYPDIGLSAAREEHRKARELVAIGINPVHERQAERERLERERLLKETGAWGNVVQAWRDKTDPDLAPGSVAQREREIRKQLTPEFKGRNIRDITRADLARVLKKVEAKTPEVAKNLRTYLDAIFEHAIDIGLVAANPTPPRRAMKRRNSTHHNAMAVGDLGRFLRDVRGSTAEPATKVAMLLVILSVGRKNEVAAAAKSEFNLEAGEWEIPAARMKKRRPHWVPLPRQAVAMLREYMPQVQGPLLFPHRDRSGASMADRTLNALMKRLGYTSETVHGFRSVFSTRYNALDRANADVVERCLAHAPKDQVRAAYNHHQYKDERRALLQDWADWLDNLADKSGIVLKLVA